MTEENRKLAEEALFRFYRLYSEKITRPAMSAYRAEFTQVEYLVLAIVSSFETIAMSDLIERARMPKQQVSRAVNELEAAGMVDKVRDPRDKRCVRLALSEKAREGMKKYAEAGASHTIRALTALSERDQADFLSCLVRMCEILDLL